MHRIQSKVRQVLENLDVEGFMWLTGCPRRSALIGLHKARCQHPNFSDELKKESTDWLTSRGYYPGVGTNKR